jgi:hypothetical protein
VKNNLVNDVFLGKSREDALFQAPNNNRVGLEAYTVVFFEDFSFLESDAV